MPAVLGNLKVKTYDDHILTLPTYSLSYPTHITFSNEYISYRIISIEFGQLDPGLGDICIPG